MNTFAKKTTQELHKDLLDKSTSLRQFRFGLSGSKTKNVKEGRELRKDIARIKTELSVRNTQTEDEATKA
ncbi:MAG: 50S ribosomal protein L29 [Candidatus Yonathbacteria bacterium]|nr:50S ribosomal protein L29 [Candidatus Yonathbacteria bacterium]